jgi:hypothetical protein
MPDNPYRAGPYWLRKKRQANQRERDHRLLRIEVQEILFCSIVSSTKMLGYQCLSQIASSNDLDDSAACLA